MSRIYTLPSAWQASSRDRLQLVLQAPTVLFAYWHVSSRKSSMISAHFGADWRRLQPALRLYDVTGIAFDGSQAAETRELPLPEEDWCFIRDVTAGRRYAADLGVVREGGLFVPLLRSAPIFALDALDAASLLTGAGCSSKAGGETGSVASRTSDRAANSVTDSVMDSVTTSAADDAAGASEAARSSGSRLALKPRDREGLSAYSIYPLNDAADYGGELP